jgi:hypothetical protein
METADLKKKVMDTAGITLDRTKAFLAAGKTHTEIYSMYTQRLGMDPMMTPELLVVCQKEVRALLAFAWPEVRAQVLATYVMDRRDAKLAQKNLVMFDPSAKEKLADGLGDAFGADPKEGN